jgi:hypothetical protein
MKKAVATLSVLRKENIRNNPNLWWERNEVVVRKNFDGYGQR